MDESITTLKSDTISRCGTILLRVATLLMSSGANTGRIRTTVNRIAGAFEYQADMHISQRVITLTLFDDQDNAVFSSLKKTPPHIVNFSIISGISRMSWRVIEENWSPDEIETELNRLSALPHYPRLAILTLVGFAGAGFCRLADGSIIDMLFVFLASFSGLFIRQEAVKANFNPYLCVYFASSVAALVAGLAVKTGLGDAGNHAFVTSVLFLIPGVPLINSISDIVDGNIQNGITRGVNGLIFSFSIALGVLTATLIYGF